jgi:hypothetical protein
VVVAEAHVVAAVPLRVARPAHVAPLLQRDWRRVWILTPPVFRLVQRKHPQQQAQAVVDAVVPAAEVVQDEVAAVPVVGAVLHKVALQLRLQAACSVQPRRT